MRTASRGFALVTTVVGALCAATAGPASAQRVVGGTLDLGQRSPTRTVVATKSHAVSVALLRGRPALAAVGEPRHQDDTGHIRIVALEHGGRRAVERAAIAGPGRGARAGVALAALDPGIRSDAPALLVGAPRARVPGRGRPGAAFLVVKPGAATRLRVGNRNVVTILGATDRDLAGASVAPMPDFDGDGRSEILVGAPGADPLGRDGAGAAYVVPGSRLRSGSIVDLADADAALRIAGPSAHSRAGASVANSLDSDGDGRGEAIVGAPGDNDGAGGAYVVNAGVGQPVDLAAPGSPVLHLFGANGERAGAALAPAVDLNGDGVRELAIGAPRAEVEGRDRTGAVYVVPLGPARGSLPLASAGARIEGEMQGDRAGSRIVQAGDVGGDPNPDLVIGAPGSDSADRLSAGAAYVVYGPAASRGRDLAFLDRRGIRLMGQDSGAVAGAALAAGVDADHDGQGEVLIGTRANDPHRPTTVATVLERNLRLPRTPRAKQRCDARPTSVVLDASAGLSTTDQRELRAGAMQLMLEHPPRAGRRIGAMEAAERPAQVFLPLVPGELTPRGITIAEDLVDESVRRTAAPGDVREALIDAGELNPRTRSAIVIVGRDAFASRGPAPFPTDVVAVGPAPSQAAGLRALAEASGGTYSRVDEGRLQAQVALLDAQNRCEKLVRPRRIERNGTPYAGAAQADGVPIDPGDEVEATANIDAEQPYADLVVTADQPDALSPYALTVTELVAGQPDVTTTFSEEQVERALAGERMTVNDLTLRGSEDDTFTALRVDFSEEDPHEPRDIAVASSHRRHRLHYRGGNRSAYGAAGVPARGYIQVFQPD